MKYYLSILIFCLGIGFAFAQYGWTEAEVTLKNGTVLKGQAVLGMMSNGITLGKEKLRFRKSKKSKEKRKKYLPKEIEQVIFTVKYKEKVGKRKVEKTRIEKYVPIFLNKKQTRLGFAQLIVGGDLKLVGRTIAVNNGGGGTWAYTGAPGSAPVYQPSMGFYGTHNRIMFLKDGTKPEIFNQVSLSKSFRKRAMKYFKDCPVLANKIKNKEYKKEDLEKIVEFYNSSCK